MQAFVLSLLRRFIFHLVSSEWDNRRNRAIERAVRQANFRYNAMLEELDYTFERGLDRNRRPKREQRPLADYAPQAGGKRS